MSLSTVKLLVTFIAALAVIGCSSHHGLNQSQIKKIFPDKPQGQFKKYSASDMRKMNLKASDFLSDAFDSPGTAIDPRTAVGTSEQHERKYLINSGVLEWTDQVTIKSLEANSVLLSHKGQVHHNKKTKKISQNDSCEASKLGLSSGVTQHELKCEGVNILEESKEINSDMDVCVVKPIGTRAVITQSEFGEFVVKGSKARYSRSTKETKTTTGEIYCDRKSVGLGRETKITYFTNEDINVSYPAVGSRKQLFQSRSIAKMNGEVLSKFSDELIGSSSPVMLAKRETSKKQMLVSKKKTDKSKKAKSKTNKGKKYASRSENKPSSRR